MRSTEFVPIVLLIYIVGAFGNEEDANRFGSLNNYIAGVHSVSPTARSFLTQHVHCTYARICSNIGLIKYNCTNETRYVNNIVCAVANHCFLGGIY